MGWRPKFSELALYKAGDGDGEAFSLEAPSPEAKPSEAQQPARPPTSKLANRETQPSTETVAPHENASSPQSNSLLQDYRRQWQEMGLGRQTISRLRFDGIEQTSQGGDPSEVWADIHRRAEGMAHDYQIHDIASKHDLEMEHRDHLLQIDSSLEGAGKNRAERIRELRSMAEGMAQLRDGTAGVADWASEYFSGSEDIDVDELDDGQLDVLRGEMIAMSRGYGPDSVRMLLEQMAERMLDKNRHGGEDDEDATGWGSDGDDDEEKVDREEALRQRYPDLNHAQMEQLLFMEFSRERDGSPIADRDAFLQNIAGTYRRFNERQSWTPTERGERIISDMMSEHKFLGEEDARRLALWDERSKQAGRSEPWRDSQIASRAEKLHLRSFGEEVGIGEEDLTPYELEELFDEWEFVIGEGLSREAAGQQVRESLEAILPPERPSFSETQEDWRDGTADSRSRLGAPNIPHHAVREYADRDHSWMHPLLVDANNPRDAIRQLVQNPVFASLATVGGLEAQLEERFEYGSFHAEGRLTLGGRSAGTITREITDAGGYLVLGNELLKVEPIARGRDYSLQFYARQEDFLRGLTDHWDDDTKRKTKVSISTAWVGKYHWMSQGFRYSSPGERKDHLRGMMVALDRLSRTGGYLATRDVSREDAVSAVGQSKRLGDIGFSDSDLAGVRSQLEECIDTEAEPWDVLELDVGPDFWMGASGSGSIHTAVAGNLIKLLALAGQGWSGVKRVHGMREKDAEGIAYADRRRHAAAERAREEGRSWGWMGQRDKAEKGFVVKSGRVPGYMYHDESPHKDRGFRVHQREPEHIDMKRKDDKSRHKEGNDGWFWEDLGGEVVRAKEPDDGIDRMVSDDDAATTAGFGVVKKGDMDMD